MSALGQMVAACDRNPCSDGYVTNLREVKEIASELTESVPVSIIRERDGDDGMMSFRVTLHFSIERSDIKGE